MLLTAVTALLLVYRLGDSPTAMGMGQATARSGNEDPGLVAQEARVYERTGSRFFQLPHCPEEPQDPPDVPILDIIGNWNPDDVAIPARHHSTLCRIDYQAERAKAFRYRDADVPFVVYNVPAFDETVRKWAQPGYLEEHLGESGRRYRVQISKGNHFLYTITGNGSPDAEAVARFNFTDFTPTTAHWTYLHWLEEAKNAENATVGAEHERQREHYYLYLRNDHPLLDQDLTIYTYGKDTLFLADSTRLKSVECRFGTSGSISEAHYDSSRNFASVVSGMRRWILAHPRYCKGAYLLPSGHPSARHSMVNWAEPNLDMFPGFANVRAHEVILMPGELIYVPPFWIHYLITLGTTIQCYAHCGKSEVNHEFIRACGFM
jgi:hypothetical protein